MIAIKTIFFFLSLLMTLFFLEDAIEKILVHSKKEGPKLTAEYTVGLLDTFSGTLMFFMVLFWTVFYLLHQF